MSELVIFGAGDLARWIRVLFERDIEQTPVAFTVHADYIGDSELEGLPVVPFESIEESHPPDRFSLFAASGYRNMNALRAEVCEQAREAGYRLPNLIPAGVHVYGDLGDNVALAPGAVVMPFAAVGSGSIVGASTTVGHDSVVGDYCYISSNSALMGRSRVGDRCFIGGGARIRDGVSVGERSVIGAGALIMKDTRPDSVHSVPGTPPRDIRSSELDDL